MEFDFGWLIYLLALLWPLLSRLFKRREAGDTAAEESSDWHLEEEPAAEPTLSRRPASDWGEPLTMPDRGGGFGSSLPGADGGLPLPQTYSGRYAAQTHGDAVREAEVRAWDVVEPAWDAELASWDDLVPEEPKTALDEHRFPASAEADGETWEAPLDERAWMLRLEQAKRRQRDVAAQLGGIQQVRGVAVHAAVHDRRERAAVAAPWTARGVAYRAGARVARQAHRAEIRDAIVLAALWSPSVARARRW